MGFIYLNRSADRAPIILHSSQAYIIPTTLQ